MLEVFRSLPRRRDVLQYRLPRRWVFGGTDQWLAQQPWQPDYQLRIVRNDPSTLRFAGTLHSSAEPRLPSRYLAEPIYHLALLVASREEREQRVREYDADSQQLVDNAGFYLPEDLSGLRVALTPPEDKALVDRVLGGVARQTKAPAEVDPVDVPLREVLRIAPGRELAPDAYDVEIECLDDAPRMVSGRLSELSMKVRNRGNERFPWGSWSPPVRASYHWLTPTREPVIWDGQRTLLTHDLAPGDAAIVPLLIAPPAEPGSYLLEVDLVHEGVRWFGCGTVVPVSVEGAVDSAPVEARGTTETGVVSITGMHRSGTSLVARLVNLLGIDFGEESDLVPPAPDNPAGFWENREIVAVNDTILAIMGGSALSPPSLLDGWEASSALDLQRQEAARLVRRLTTGERLVGWKDPRMSLTLPFWRTVAPLTKTVLALRHPAEVAHSLAARNHLSESDAGRLYVLYVVSALRNDPRCVVVRYDELFDDFSDAVSRLALGLGLDRPDEPTLKRLRGTVQPVLRHTRLEPLDGQGELKVGVAVYRLLSEGRRDVVLDLSHALLNWALGREPGQDADERSQEMAGSLPPEAELATEPQALGAGRLMGIRLSLAERARRLGHRAN